MPRRAKGVPKEGGRAQGPRAAKPFGETVQSTALYIERDAAGSIHCLLCCKSCQRKHLASTAHANASPDAVRCLPPLCLA